MSQCWMKVREHLSQPVRSTLALLRDAEKGLVTVAEEDVGDGLN